MTVTFRFGVLSMQRVHHACPITVLICAAPRP